MEVPVADRGAAPVLMGRYELGRRIARGGMADVFEARDHQLQRRVAVKVFRAGAGDRARFDAEVRILASLTHPGLVPVYDAGEHEGEAFVVMELVDGPTLASRLASSGSVPPDEVADVGARIADALASVHENGVVHRDVTPSNILCGADGRARLADFGIARLVDSARVTVPAATLGTAAYMAPEQVLGGDVTPAADVYALGLVLLEALTGSRAFAGPAREAAVARLTRPPTVPDDLPAGWPPLLEEMTSRDPSDRPGAAAVRDRLGALISEPRAATEAGGEPTAPPVVGPAVAVPAPPGAAGIASDEVTRVHAPADRTAVLPVEPATETQRGRRRLPGALVLGGVAVAAVLVAGLALAGGSDPPTLPPTTVTEPVVTRPTVTVATTAPTTLTTTAPSQPAVSPAPGPADRGKPPKGKGGKGSGKGRKG